MDKLKYIKFQESQEQYSNSIPIGVDAENVDLKTGNNLQEIIGDYDLSKGTIEKRLSNFIVDKTLTLENTPADAATVGNELQKIKNKTNNFVTPEMFGAIGNGKYDDTEAFQQAINSGFPVFVNGTYFIKDINFISNTLLVCTPQTYIKLDVSNHSSISSGIINICGNQNKSYEIDSYSNDLFVCSKTTFSIGDLIILKNGFNDFTTKVTKVDGNTYYVANNIPIIPTSVVKLVPIKGVRLYGNGCTLDLLGSPPNEEYGNFIEIKYAEDIIIDDFKCIKGAGKAVDVRHGFNIKIYNIQDDEKFGRGITGKGESMLIANSSCILIENCLSTNADRGFDFSGSYYCRIYKCTCINSRFTCHGYNSRFITFESCFAYGQNQEPQRYAFLFGNAPVSEQYPDYPQAGTDHDIFFINCEARNFAYGFYGAYYSSNATLINCRFFDCRVPISAPDCDNIRIINGYIESNYYAIGSTKDLEFSGKIIHNAPSPNNLSYNVIMGTFNKIYLHDSEIITNKTTVFNTTKTNEIHNILLNNVKITSSYTGNKQCNLTNTSTVGEISIKNSDIDPKIVTTLVGTDNQIINSTLGKILISEDSTKNIIIANNICDYSEKTLEPLFETNLQNQMINENNVMFNYT